MKFTFQAYLVTLAKIQDTPAREDARSHSSCILSFDLIGQHQNKRFHVTEIVLLFGFAGVIFRRERSDDRKYVCGSQAIHTPVNDFFLHTKGRRPGGVGSEVWNRVYMIAPVKKFVRVRLSTNFPLKQIWRSMRTWKDDEFSLGFTFYGTFFMKFLDIRMRDV